MDSNSHNAELIHRGRVVSRLRNDGSSRPAKRHQHAEGQLLSSMGSPLSVSTGEGRWLIPATHCVWIPPHQAHTVEAHGAFSAWTAYISAKECSRLPTTLRILRTSGLLREAILRSANCEGPIVQMIGELVAKIVVEEIRTLPEERVTLPMPNDYRLKRIAETSIADPRDSRPLKGWAALGSLSVRTLTRKFKEETGLTFDAWRQRARVLVALEMLKEGASVTTTAIDLGYQNVSAFILVFRRTFGITPGVYKARSGSSDCDPVAR